jgi:hypothetical protein
VEVKMIQATLAVRELTALIAIVIAQIAGTGVPSDSPPPSSSSDYRTAELRARVLGKLLELADGGAIELETRRRLEKLGPEIAKAMPTEGGVLILISIAEEKDKGMRIYRHREVNAVYIAGPGKDEKDALERYQKENSTSSFRAVDGPLPPMDLARIERQEHLIKWYNFSTRRLWIASPAKVPPAETVIPPVDKSALLRMIEELQVRCDQERARLEVEGAAIEREDARLRQGREDEIKPNRGRGARRDEAETAEAREARIRGRENDRIQAFEQQKQRELAGFRETVNSADQSIQAKELELKRLNEERCLAGLTLEQCEAQQDAGRTVHLDFRVRVRTGRVRLHTEIQTLKERRDQAFRAAEQLAARLPGDVAARKKQVETTVRSEVKKVETDRFRKDAIDDAEEAFRQRLKLFAEDSARLDSWTALIADAQKLVRTIP